MEAPHQDGLCQDVPVDGLQNLRASGLRPQGELCIQREELERVMVMRPWGGRASFR